MTTNEFAERGVGVSKRTVNGIVVEGKSMDQEFQLAEYDSQLLADCIDQKPHAWENFVDRFLVLIAHTVDHTTKTRGIEVTSDQREQLIEDVFLCLNENEFQLLKAFHGQSEFSTYLAVISRRIIVRNLVRMPDLKFTDPDPTPWETVSSDLEEHSPETLSIDNASAIEPEENQLEIGRQMIEMLAALNASEQQIVGLHYTKQKSPEEISQQLNLPLEQVQEAINSAMNSTRQLLQRRAA